MKQKRLPKAQAGARLEALRAKSKRQRESIDRNRLTIELRGLLPDAEEQNLLLFSEAFCHQLEVYWLMSAFNPVLKKRDQHLRDFKKVCASLQTKISQLLGELYVMPDKDPDVLLSLNMSGRDPFDVSFSNAAIETLETLTKLSDLITKAKPLPTRTTTAATDRFVSLMALYRAYHRYISEKAYPRKGYGLYEIVTLFLKEIEQPQSPDNMRKLMAKLQQTKILKPRTPENTATGIGHLAAIISQSGKSQP